MSDGCSFTTITMRPGCAPRIGVHLYPDRYAEVNYFPATDSTAAFVSISHGGTSLSIGTASDATVTDAHVDFARKLACAAAQFLDNCERLRDEHATRDNHTGTGTGQIGAPGAVA
ncbi:hypothetical protein GCM10009677_27660 [Sphaerisporangium rubeum]|uniref:Uncharacterized protein n=1 Tax=Sphaerisporangium rubeum TaxID=321317 RepID=A0A7X0IAK2_9ACTN|nr:hypothetical protein [Sphaerisporangium rubeum]MBB6471674.1 hypothetical protein [Sphaerisporangium rubeum]